MAESTAISTPTVTARRAKTRWWDRVPDFVYPLIAIAIALVVWEAICVFFRVPLYIRAPGFPRQVTTRAALNNDLASTVSEFAGITPGLAVDGRSLLPLLRNPLETNWRKRFLVEYLGTVESKRNPPRVPFRAVRTTDLSRATPADQFYVEWQDGLGSKEFYNLPADPGQLASRHADPVWAGVRNLLAGWLSQFRNCGGGSCQALEDE